MNKVHDHKGTITQAKKYCKDDVTSIENYDKMMQDTTQMWHCHHRREIDEHKSRQQLIQDNLYYDRPARELIFLTKSEHKLLHNANMSATTRKKMSEAKKGNKNAAGKRTDQQKKKISEATKEAMNHLDVKEKMSVAIKEAMNRPDVKKKISEAAKGNTNVRGKKWWNNGVKQVRAFECPGEGYEQGMLKKETYL